MARIRLDPGNLRDLSKGYFATTFLSSSLTCPATQSGLCGAFNDLTLLAPAQITIYNKKVVDHTVTADGISGNLADVRYMWVCRA